MSKCKRCGLIYCYTPEDEIRKFYDSAEYDQQEKYLEQEQWLRTSFTKRELPLLRKYKNEGRLLDVGASWGFFMDVAKGHYEVKGVDLSVQCSTYARDVLGLDVLTGTLEDAHFKDGEFDIVTMWNVLEHIAELLRALTEAKRVLRRGGLIFIMTPNADGLDARLTGSYWTQLNHPGHLVLFSPRTIRLALEKTGFVIREVKTREWGSMNILLSCFSPIVYKLGLYQPLREGWVQKGGLIHYLYTAANVVANLSCLPLAPSLKLLYLKGAGPELVAIAEKQ